MRATVKTCLWLVVGSLSFAPTSAFSETEKAESLNELLRGELSAVETYDQALEKIRGDEYRNVLNDFRQDHVQFADYLSKRVKELGGTPSQSSGPWGTWSELVVGTAKLVGPETTIAALRKGEEHGLSEYQEALEEGELKRETVSHIKEEIIPKQQTHIQELSRLEGKMDKIAG